MHPSTGHWLSSSATHDSPGHRTGALLCCHHGRMDTEMQTLFVGLVSAYADQGDTDAQQRSASQMVKYLAAGGDAEASRDRVIDYVLLTGGLGGGLANVAVLASDGRLTIEDAITQAVEALEAS